MVRTQVDDAEAWIESTLLRWRKVTDRSRRILGRFKNASANSNVGLLRTGESGKLKKRKRRQNQRELSQIQPPCPFVQTSGMWPRQSSGARRGSREWSALAERTLAVGTGLAETQFATASKITKI
jgi:hypothetical protein